MKKKVKDLSWLKHELIAHRGFHSKDGLIPENSWLAFDLAMKHGYAIECDVNVLKDGTAVVFHDPDLKRLCHDQRLLEEVTWDEVKHFKLLNTEETILTLQDLLGRINGKKPLLIELKPHGNVALLCKSVMAVLKDYQGLYALFSFHPKVVYYLKKHHPEVIRGQIAEYFKTNQSMPKIIKWMMKNMVFNRFTKPDFVSYSVHDLPNKKLDRLKARGMTIISYAAQNQKEFDHVLNHYDNVVFEYFKPKQKGDV